MHHLSPVVRSLLAAHLIAFSACSIDSARPTPEVVETEWDDMSELPAQHQCVAAAPTDGVLDTRSSKYSRKPPLHG